MSSVVKLEDFLQEQTELMDAKTRLNTAERRISELESKSKPMVSTGEVKPVEVDFTKLRHRYPHLAELTGVVERAAALATLRPDKGFILPAPLLLVGDPGIGKTDFCQYFTDNQLHMELIDGGALTAGFEITGASPVWKGGKAGRVYEALKSGSANPIIILDEIDKINDNPVSPIYSALGGLLEPTTAAQFKDEFYDELIDASCINWIMTANDIRQIPEHIIDRCEVIFCNNPDHQQRQMVIKSIYEALAIKLHANHIILNEEVMDNLAYNTVSFRVIKRAITNAIATCVLLNNTEIQLDHIKPFLHSTTKIKIGF